MKKGTRQIRLCACGCGKNAKQVTHNGRFKGYYKYAEGCDAFKWSEDRKKQYGQKWRGMDHVRALPIGSKRLTVKNHRSDPYVEIKVHESGRWILEHRHVMEVFLGRKLKTSEHVHHINGSTVDNRTENLIVLTPDEHMAFTHNGTSPHELAKKYKKPHKCPLCGVMHEWPEG